ncbi:transcription termination/antitermination NusG family protein [Tunturiibacter gelidiferens]|uniref:transcription termination/antitermination NusG family protein n=1 Tax=Tunturiibacter gelidiferens TaxID=3069689 RepID=UPI003D9B4FBF
MSDVPRWYAVYTHPRHEMVVTKQLESRSVEAFLPTFVTESRWKDRRVRIQTPVFPAYVFTRIKLAERSKVEPLAAEMTYVRHSAIFAFVTR